MRTLLADGLRSVAHLFADGARALAAHWPQLVALFLLGWAGRMGFLWLTTIVSDVSPTLAIFILPLAPLCTLLSLVLMLRAMGPTLPAFRDLWQPLPPRQRLRDDLTVAAQVLIPFLAVYASAGLLAQDTQTFLRDSFADEALNANVQSMDYGRANYAEGWVLVAFIVGALVARKIISILELAKRHVAWAAVGTYLEVLWMITLAATLTSRVEELAGWVTSRRAIADLLGWWESVVATLRAWGGWATVAVDAVIAFLGSLGSLVIVPVAWLAIGAAVYGHTLKARELKVETHEEVTRRINKMPQRARKVVAHAVEPVTTPVSNTLKAIGKVASAGVVPMVLFCVVFAVASRLQVLVAEAMRALIGPGPMTRQYALEPYALMAERGVYFVIAMALLAAAVNTVVASQREQADAPAPAVT